MKVPIIPKIPYLLFSIKYMVIELEHERLYIVT